MFFPLCCHYRRSLGIKTLKSFNIILAIEQNLIKIKVMKISTFNINSINARLPILTDWLQKTAQDVVMLQEIKTESADFPYFDLKTIGYESKILGQKSYNGVAVLSPHKLEVITEGLPDFEDENKRYLEVLVQTPETSLRVASVYLPNGNPPHNNPDDTSKFEYKLAFMNALYKRAQKLLEIREKVVLGGDFNVILSAHDVYNAKLFQNNALFREPVKQRLIALQYLGFYDAFRILHPESAGYTFWDYTNRAFETDLGMRIDYLFLSPAMADYLKECFVDKNPRTRPKPSDHTPLTAVFDFSDKT